jgi:hypothetical protein
MCTYNFYLTVAHENKGGGKFLEDPCTAVNITCQTTAREADAFESRLADTLMAVFAEGVAELELVVEELNKHGSRARDGSPWTDTVFQEQLARSASRLFAVERADD